MGVTGLLPALKECLIPTHISALSGKVVAIDGYSWLHKATYGCALELATGQETDRYVWYCLSRARMMVSLGVTPFFVFDGAPLPSKSSTNAERSQNRLRHRERGQELLQQGRTEDARSCFQQSSVVTPKMAHHLIEAIKRVPGMKFLVAPFEADAQLAFLESSGTVHAVITEDADLIAFGCKRILFKMDSSGHGQLFDLAAITSPDYTPVAPSLDLTKFTPDMVRWMCILSGCDYLPSVKGLGIKTAYQLVRRYRDPRKVIFFLKQDRKRSWNVPNDYEANFIKADLTFRHQIVFDPSTNLLVHATPLDQAVRRHCERSVSGEPVGSEPSHTRQASPANRRVRQKAPSERSRRADVAEGQGGSEMDTSAAEAQVVSEMDTAPADQAQQRQRLGQSDSESGSQCRTPCQPLHKDRDTAVGACTSDNPRPSPTPVAAKTHIASNTLHGTLHGKRKRGTVNKSNGEAKEPPCDGPSEQTKEIGEAMPPAEAIGCTPLRASSRNKRARDECVHQGSGEPCGSVGQSPEELAGAWQGERSEAAAVTHQPASSDDGPPGPPSAVVPQPTLLSFFGRAVLHGAPMRGPKDEAQPRLSDAAVSEEDSAAVSSRSTCGASDAVGNTRALAATLSGACSDPEGGVLGNACPATSDAASARADTVLVAESSGEESPCARRRRAKLNDFDADIVPASPLRPTRTSARSLSAVSEDTRASSPMLARSPSCGADEVSDFSDDNCSTSVRREEALPTSSLDAPYEYNTRLFPSDLSFLGLNGLPSDLARDICAHGSVCPVSRLKFPSQPPDSTAKPSHPSNDGSFRNRAPSNSSAGAKVPRASASFAAPSRQARAVLSVGRSAPHLQNRPSDARRSTTLASSPSVATAGNSGTRNDADAPVISQPRVVTNDQRRADFNALRAALGISPSSSTTHSGAERSEQSPKESASTCQATASTGSKELVNQPTAAPRSLLDVARAFPRLKPSQSLSRVRTLASFVGSSTRPPSS